MDILVFSDSHGRRDNIAEVIMRQVKAPDALIFLGDGLKDIDDRYGIPIYEVCGNCDFCSDSSTERLIELGSKRILITHGHKYFVKESFLPLISSAVNKKADVVLFGHTHECLEKRLDIQNEYGIKLDKPMYIMNPGSIGYYPHSFGLITIDREGRVLMSHGSLL